MAEAQGWQHCSAQPTLTGGGSAERHGEQHSRPHGCPACALCKQVRQLQAS